MEVVAWLRSNLPAVGAGLSVVAIFVAVLSIPLSVAVDLGLSEAETVAWILALYGVSGCSASYSRCATASPC